MQYLYVKHTSRKSTIKLHSNLKKIFFTWMKKEELLRSLKQKLLLYILEAWLISPYFISALRLISFCEWCLFATPLYCHMGETNRDSYLHMLESIPLFAIGAIVVVWLVQTEFNVRWGGAQVMSVFYWIMYIFP